MKKVVKKAVKQRARARRSQLPAVVAAAPPPPAVLAPPAPVLYSKAVSQAVLAVQSDIEVIAKAGWNAFQRYKYAKWEDVAAALYPLLTKNKLLIHQSEVERTVIDRGAGGSVLAIVYDFTFINAESNEAWPPVRWTGMARLIDAKGVPDDKAAAKCHTSAEKYCAIKLFKIRTEEAQHIDADADDGAPPRPTPPPQPAPDAMRSENPAPPQQRQPPSDPKPLKDIAAVKALEEEAKLAADMGSDAFAALWRARASEQERAILRGLGPILREKMTAADQHIAARAAGADPQTGEIAS